MEAQTPPPERAVERLRKALADLPDNVRLARAAERALDDIQDEEAARILEDIARIAQRQFPGEVKPITMLPGRPLQADAGRFRVLFRWQQRALEVIMVFPRSVQQRIFRRMKRHN